MHAVADTHARTKKPTPTPSPEWPSRRACLCQQMSGRRCVFLCLSLHSFHPLLQRLPICLWLCFISAHSNPPLHPRGCCVCCITGRGGVESANTPRQCYSSATAQPFKIRLVRLGPGSYYGVVLNERTLFGSVFHSCFCCLLSQAHSFYNVTKKKIATKKYQ